MRKKSFPILVSELVLLRQCVMNYGKGWCKGELIFYNLITHPLLTYPYPKSLKGLIKVYVGKVALTRKVYKMSKIRAMSVLHFSTYLRSF